MFETTILILLLGLVLWFILSRDQSRAGRKVPYIELTAELRPAASKPEKKRPF